MNIRLIAADMDGTLLDSRKQLPEGLFPLVRALHERGVRFAPASGRQFYTLYEQFGEIADELMYISENGAMICDGSECVGFSAMPREVVLDAIERVRTLPGVYGHFRPERRILRKKSSAEAVRNFNMYCALHRGARSCGIRLARADLQGRAVLRRTRRAGAHAGVCRLCRTGAARALGHGLGRPHADRREQGRGARGAVRHARHHDGGLHGGDYLNDIELLRTAGESCAMANAHEQLAALAKYRCPSNDEDGVCRTIRAVFDL